MSFELSSNYKFAIFDVAGTTVLDEGIVIESFLDALDVVEPRSTKVEQYLQVIQATMGERKIDVFLKIFGELNKAEQAHEAFVKSYLARVRRGEVLAIPGSEALFSKLRNQAVKIGLNTGFSRNILDAIIESLGWQTLVDYSVASSEVNLGRPAPDMILSLVERYQRDVGHDLDGSEIVVFGDTIADIESAKRAGIDARVAIHSGVHTVDELTEAGASVVISSVADVVVK
ncbi:MAG: HAD family hydrolase [Actinobacteria bacterium]|nr:HAD family hydrolase [Actinomycetota bacterium]